MTAISCHHDELSPAQYPDTVLRLTADIPSFDITGTKAEATADSLFAYPFNSGTDTPVEPLRFDNYTGGQYWFTIPAETESILFTNVSGHEENLEIQSGLPEFLLEISSKDGQYAGHDVYFGGIAEYSTGEPEQTIALTRAVARLRPVLKMVIDEDTLSDLTSQFDSVRLSVEGISKGIRLGKDFSYTTFGQNSISTRMDVTTAACTAESIYTFPSITQDPSMSLHVFLKDGTELEFSGTLPESILANHDYTLCIYLHKDNTDAGFTLDMTMNEITVENPYGGTFDIVSFDKDVLFFSVDEGISNELTVESLTGQWSTTVPLDVIQYFSIENKRTGDMVTSERPTLSGMSGDTLLITTVRNMNGSETPITFDIPFKADAHNTYNVTLVQSNGQNQRIDLDMEYGYLSIEGFCTLYRMDGTDSTEIRTISGSYGNYLDGGVYRISGDVLTYFEAEHANSIEFHNTTSLMDLRVYNPRNAMTGLDLNGLAMLKSVTIHDYESNGTAFETITAQGLERLETVDLQSLRALKTLSLPDCPALESIVLNCSSSSSLTSVDISNSTNLRNFEANIPNAPVRVLDFSGSGIRTIDLDGNSSTMLSTLNVSECSDIDEIQLANLPRLSSIVSDNASIRYMSIRGSDSLTVLSIPGLDIDSVYLDDMRNLTSITADNSSIIALKGLEYYNATPDLERLSFQNCANLKKLELSALDRITLLDVRNCTSLGELILDDGQDLSGIEKFNVTGCSAMKTFRLYNVFSSNYCFGLDSLDLSGCTSLDSLEVYDNGYSNSTLSRIILDQDANLRSAGIRLLPKLSEISMNGTSIQNLYIKSCNTLVLMNLTGTEIQNADIRDCSNLAQVILSGTPARQLTLYNLNNLSRVYADECQSLNTINIESCSNLYDIDLTNSPALVSMRIWNHNSTQISSIDDIRTCPALENLQLSWLNNIEQIDLRQNTSLKTLELANMTGLKLLNCSGLAGLTEYICEDYAPETLILDNCVSLKTLHIWGSNLDSLSANGLTSVEEFSLNNTSISGDLVLSDMPSLRHLWLGANNSLTSLTVNGSPELNYIGLDENRQIARLSIGENNKLSRIYLRYNYHLKFSDCAFNAQSTLRSFHSISCGSSNTADPAETLDLSSYTLLDTVNVVNNTRLSVLNLNGCSSLTVANLDQNSALAQMDLTGCKSILKLDMYRCDFQADALNTIFTQLPERQPADIAELRMKDCPGESQCDDTIAGKKNWTPTANDIAPELKDLDR